MSSLDEALQALDSGNVYVSATVQATSANPVNEAKLEKELSGSDIAVVILPDSAMSEIDSIPAFINQIAANTNYQTILVAVGSDLDAKSNTLNQPGLASTLANQAEQQHPGDLTAATEQFVASVQANTPAPATPVDDSIGINGITGIGLGLVGLVVLVSGGVTGLKGYKRYRKNRVLAGIQQHLTTIEQQTRAVHDRHTKDNLGLLTFNMRQLLKTVNELPNEALREDAASTVKSRYEMGLQELESITTKLIRTQVMGNGGADRLNELNRSITTFAEAASNDRDALVTQAFNDFEVESIGFQALFPPNILGQ